MSITLQLYESMT